MPPDLSAAPRLACTCSAVLALCITLLSIAIALPGVAAPAPDTTGIDDGARIYREGVMPSGQPLLAIGAGGNTLSGADAACAKCHRRSGLGGAEGDRVIPPITADVLFDMPVATPLPDTAARYDTTSLGRLLREGHTPGTKQLDALMPRYRLDPSEQAALVAYLHTLRPGPDPGVTATELHIATLFAGDIAPERRAAILDVLQTYIADHNAQTRAESRRARYGRDTMDRAFRLWRLHVWELHGNTAQWPTQLQTQYQQQPVFAVLSGASTGEWQPVHNFCEQRQLPCIFPSIDIPGASDPGEYTFYLSKGLVLEAEALAAYLAEQRPRLDTGKIVQVYRANGNGAVAAHTLHNALKKFGQYRVDDHVIRDATTPDTKFWIDLISNHKPSLVILWLPATDLKNFAQGIGRGDDLRGIFASARYTGERVDWVPDALVTRTFLTYPFALPKERAAKAARVTEWLSSRKIPHIEPRLQAEAYFTVTAVAGALKHMNGLYSRDYFVERLENMIEASLTSADFPHVSLGPGQRYASKGCYIVQATKNDRQLTAVSRWLIP